MFVDMGYQRFYHEHLNAPPFAPRQVFPPRSGNPRNQLGLGRYAATFQFFYLAVDLLAVDLPFVEERAQEGGKTCQRPTIGGLHCCRQTRQADHLPDDLGRVPGLFQHR